MTLEVAIRQHLGAFALEAEFAAAEGVTALFGPSGAGKSSIVRAVAGLLRPQEGRIVIAGRTVLDTASGVFVPPEARHAGLVFQDARLFPHMTVENNLLFGWRRAPVKAGADEIARVIALLGLEQLRPRLPGNLSGGEQRRVALGRALLASPDILLLDEPLANLDADRQAEILPWLERLRDGARIPMLYVSHAVDEVARLADRVVLLKEGRVTASGSVFDMLTGPQSVRRAAGRGAGCSGDGPARRRPGRSGVRWRRDRGGRRARRRHAAASADRGGRHPDRPPGTAGDQRQQYLARDSFGGRAVRASWPISNSFAAGPSWWRGSRRRRPGGWNWQAAPPSMPSSNR